MKKIMLMCLLLVGLVSCNADVSINKGVSNRYLKNIYENTMYSGIDDESGDIWFIQVDNINFVREQLQEWKIPCQDITLIFEKKDYYPYKIGKLYEYSDYTYLYYSVNL